jgi:FkbM family methyltransferase
VPDLTSNSLVGKALRLPLRLLPEGTRMPIVRGPLIGKRWIVGAHTHGCWLGTYEQPVQRALLNLLRPGATFFDVGANAGFHTLLASVLVGPRGPVLAVEPSPRNLSYLREHVRMNDLGNVVVVDAAAADRAGSAFFDATSGTATGRLAATGISVTTVTLDDVVGSGTAPDPEVLKIDVEGAEALVLEGAYSVLRRARPHVLLAAHSSDLLAECRHLLEEAGYSVGPLDHARGAQSFDLLGFHPSRQPPVPRVHGRSF